MPATSRLAGAPVRTLRMLVVGAVAAPLLVFAGAAYVAYDNVVRRASADLTRAAEIAEEQVTRTLDTNRLVAAWINELVGPLTAEAIIEREPELHEQLFRMGLGLDQIESLWVLDAQGRLLVGSARQPIDHIDLSHRAYFQALKDGSRSFYIGGLEVGAITGNRFFVYARRKDNGSGEFDGVIAVAAAPAYFNAFYDKLIRHNPDYLVRLLRQGGETLTLYPEGTVPPGALASDELREAIDRAPSGGLLRVHNGHDSVDRLVAYNRVESYGLYITVGRTWASIMAEWQRTMLSELYFGAPATLALVLLSAYGLRRARREAEALNHAREAIARREMTARALHETELRLYTLLNSVTDYGIFMLDAEGRVTTWNRGAELIKGYRAEEVLGRSFARFFTEEDRRDGLPARVLATAARDGRVEMEGWRLRKDGSRFWAAASINAVRDGTGRLIGFAKVSRDLTERRAIEERLRQSQKIEAIGQLTGGVAHDFNNLLTVIMGSIDLLERRFRDRDPGERRHLATIMRAANTAAALTRQLLAFSRRQALDPKPVRLDTFVTGMGQLLRRTLGEQIAVETILPADLWWTSIDVNQLESALLNLAVNARDAMAGGGTLTIEADNVVLDERYVAGEEEVTPGEYVMLAVSDTGKGMSPEIQSKAFEPFFTTKETGRGSGLGLSQVYGFAKQSNGHAKIYSEVGRGTTVKLYFPRLVRPGLEAPPVPPAAAPALPSVAPVTVLVVEDDDDVRSSAVEMLRTLGHTVLEAADGESALRILTEHPETAVLFTDVGLPDGMNGRQLATEAVRRLPALHVIFTTGYTRDAIVHQGLLDPDVEVIAKPFTIAELAAKLAQVLAFQD